MKPALAPWIRKESRGCRRTNMASTGFLFILREERRAWCQGRADFIKLDVQSLRWAARPRRGYFFLGREKAGSAARRGARGGPRVLVFAAQWYVFVARNYTLRGIKGEIDLVGYDGKTLIFVEVRTRTVREDLTALPELSFTGEKQPVVVRTALQFLAERRVGECPCRFDVVAIDNRRATTGGAAASGRVQPPNVTRCSERMLGTLHGGARRSTIQ